MGERGQGSPDFVGNGASRTMLVEAAIMSKTYTHSTWRVKPGLEDEFVRR
jgi:hypothetical protein